MTGYSDEQIEALIAAATPGPWEVRNLRDSQNDYDWWWVWRQGVTSYAGVMDMDADEEPGGVGLASITDRDRSEREQADAEFIAAARELVPSLLARAQPAEAVAERLRQFNAAKDQRDAALADAVRLRAELAEAKDALADVCCDECRRGTDVTSSEQLARVRAERDEAREQIEQLRQVAQSDRETAKDYADEVAAAHAERDRLAAQVAAVRALADKWADAQGLLWCSLGARALRAALDGTEHDEAKRGPKVIARRDAKASTHAADCPCPTCARPTEGDEQ